jgi:hypothetical protein
MTPVAPTCLTRVRAELRSSLGHDNKTPKAKQLDEGIANTLVSDDFCRESHVALVHPRYMRAAAR